MAVKVSRAEWIAIAALCLTIAGQVFSMGVVWREGERVCVRVMA